jgi:hypothetical protein
VSLDTLAIKAALKVGRQSVVCSASRAGMFIPVVLTSLNRLSDCLAFPGLGRIEPRDALQALERLPFGVLLALEQLNLGTVDKKPFHAEPPPRMTVQAGDFVVSDCAVLGKCFCTFFCLDKVSVRTATAYADPCILNAVLNQSRDWVAEAVLQIKVMETLGTVSYRGIVDAPGDLFPRQGALRIGKGEVAWLALTTAVAGWIVFETGFVDVVPFSAGAVVGDEVLVVVDTGATAGEGRCAEGVPDIVTGTF